MTPRTKMLLSIAAAVIGLALLLAVFANSRPVNAAEVFLGALLLVGGAVGLWTRAKSGDAKEADTKPRETGRDDYLAQFLKK